MSDSNADAIARRVADEVGEIVAAAERDAAAIVDRAREEAARESAAIIDRARGDAERERVAARAQIEASREKLLTIADELVAILRGLSTRLDDVVGLRVDLAETVMEPLANEAHGDAAATDPDGLAAEPAAASAAAPDPSNPTEAATDPHLLGAPALAVVPAAPEPEPSPASPPEAVAVMHGAAGDAAPALEQPLAAVTEVSGDGGEETAPAVNGSGGSDEARAPGEVRPAAEQLDAARLVALSMAAGGSDRAEVERHLSEQFDDRSSALVADYIFGTAADPSIVPGWPPAE